MRFKTIFLVFNLVIVASFLFIFFMPLLLLGGDQFGEFVSRNWASGLLFAAALVGFNAYFLRSWRLFELLEREDWAGLITHLEKQVYEAGRITRRNLKILINSYLVTSKTEEINRLQAHVAERKPGLAAALAIPFGVPHLLLNRPLDAERYFGRMMASAGPRDRKWLSWSHAFSLLQMREVEAARSEFGTLVEDHKDPFLFLLSLYMLDSLAGKESDERAALQSKAEEFRRRHPAKAWNRRLQNAGGGNVQLLILSRIIREASDWVFGAPAGGPAH
jgi:hypothetical protein